MDSFIWIKTIALIAASLLQLCSSISTLVHIILFFSEDETTDEFTEYTTANALAVSIVSCATNCLLLYGVIKVTIDTGREN